MRGYHVWPLSRVNKGAVSPGLMTENNLFSVLEQDPENEEGKNILERVESIIKEKDDETKGKRRKKKKKVTSLQLVWYLLTCVYPYYLF